MLQRPISVTPWSPNAGQGNYGGQCGPSRNPYYDKLCQQAQRCKCHHYNQFFNQNQNQIYDRCCNRRPGSYQTDSQGCRWENGRPAQTQIKQQCPNSATITTGRYEMHYNREDQSVNVVGPNGLNKRLDLKVFGDPHIRNNGQDIGTIQNDLSLRLDDGTVMNFLMGDGNGGPPQFGKPTFVNTVATRAPDGTGALVTGISGPGPLGVTPLDSGISSEFMEGNALGKFGLYAPSQIEIDREGRLRDSTSQAYVSNQSDLNVLDKRQLQNEWAANLYQQGYVPRPLADHFGIPQHQYNAGMQGQVRDQIMQMLQRFYQMQQSLGSFGFGSLQMPMARFDQPSAYQPYGLAA